MQTISFNACFSYYNDTFLRLFGSIALKLWSAVFWQHCNQDVSFLCQCNQWHGFKARLLTHCLYIFARYETTKAANAVAALKASLKPFATVKRDGKWQQIDARVVVPGDLVGLNAGAAVPADCRVSKWDCGRATASICIRLPLEHDEEVLFSEFQFFCGSFRRFLSQVDQGVSTHSILYQLLCRGF